MRKSILLILPVMFALSLPAWGATIKLKDGSELQGEIIEKGKTMVKIRIEGGIELEVDGNNIASVDGQAYAVDLRTVYDERLREMDDTKADDHYRVAAWCKEKGLEAESKMHLKKALGIEPTHKGANLALGRVYIEKEGKWMDKYEAQKKGYKASTDAGIWITEKEAMQARGFEEYKGAMLSKEEIERRKAEEFTRWKSYYYTHTVCDLKDQLVRIGLFNKLQLSKEQTEEFYVVLAEAANAAAMFMDSRHEVNTTAEQAFNVLRFENQKGVYAGFDIPASAQRPAGEAEGAVKKLPKAYCHTMSQYLDRLEKILARTGPRTQKGSQLFKVDHDYCMCCHKDKAGNNECAQCHRGERKVKANPAGVAALKEARTMNGADWAKKKDQIIRAWMKPVTGETSRERKQREMEEYQSVEGLFTKARDLDETSFMNDLPLMSTQLAARTDIDRARLELDLVRGRMEKMARAHESEAMMMDCFFDGTMLELLRGKVKRPKALVAMGEKTSLVEKQSMFDGKTMLEQVCTKCHVLNRVYRRIKEAPRGAEWDECIPKMIASLPPDLRAAAGDIAEYLRELEGQNKKDVKDKDEF